MKVILRTDVENLGSLGDLVEVKPGYGRNYLLPQGYAMKATPANMKVFELERKKLQEKADTLRGAASSLATKISEAKISIAMRVGENDKLYGSVTSSMIAEALVENGIDVDRRRILLDHPIRLIGEYAVRIRLHAGIIAELALAIVPERTYNADDELAEQDQSQEVKENGESATTEETV